MNPISRHKTFNANVARNYNVENKEQPPSDSSNSLASRIRRCLKQIFNLLKVIFTGKTNPVTNQEIKRSIKKYNTENPIVNLTQSPIIEKQNTDHSVTPTISQTAASPKQIINNRKAEKIPANGSTNPIANSTQSPHLNNHMNSKNERPSATLIRVKGGELYVGPLKAHHALAAAGATAVGLLGSITYVAFKALGLNQPLIATLIVVPIMVSMAVVAVTLVALSHLPHLYRIFEEIAEECRRGHYERCVIL